MSEPTFGGILRGLRLGYGWSAEHSAFVRISGNGPFCVEVAPGPIPPTHPSGDKQHWRWWDADDKGVTLLAMISELPREPRSVRVLWVGEYGETLASP